MIDHKILRASVIILLALSAVGSGFCGNAGEPVSSYKYIVVYGTGSLQIEDVVEFLDPDGIVCGKWVVRDAGAYGLTAVYGDDPTTADLDEGARLGEELTIRVNGTPVIPPDGPPVWEDEGEVRRIDL